MAVGSVASAAISTLGWAPRSMSRPKFGGMLSTNSTSPRRIASSASASLS